MNRRNPFASRIDENEPEIVKALEAHGISVVRLKDVGKGCPDLLCGYTPPPPFDGRGYRMTVLIEVKRDYDYATTKRGKPYIEKVRGKLTEGQERWHAEWKGQPVVIARSPEEALAAFGL